MMIAGLHCAFILFHNRAVDWARDHGYEGGTYSRRHASSRRGTTTGWSCTSSCHRSSASPRSTTCCATEAASTRPHGRGVHPGRVPDRHLPVRAQHGPAVLPRKPRRATTAAVLRDGLRPCRDGQADPVDLRGGARAPRRFIGWQTFFDFGDGNVKPTSGSTRRSRRRSSTFRSARSRATTHRRRCRSATCSASSPGACPPAVGRPGHGRHAARSRRPRGAAALSASSAARRSGTTC